VKVADVDLDADTDNTGSISGSSSEDEAEEKDPGVIVPRNDGTEKGNTDVRVSLTTPFGLSTWRRCWMHE
jgi:hypothetical protein